MRDCVFDRGGCFARKVFAQCCNRGNAVEQLPERHGNAEAIRDLLHDATQKERIEAEFEERRSRIDIGEILTRDFFKKRDEIACDSITLRIDHRGRNAGSFAVVHNLSLKGLHVRPRCRRLEPVAAPFEGIRGQRNARVCVLREKCAYIERRTDAPKFAGRFKHVREIGLLALVRR